MIIWVSTEVKRLLLKEGPHTEIREIKDLDNVIKMNLVK
jgi:hypothetical protein